MNTDDPLFLFIIGIFLFLVLKECIYFLNLYIEKINNPVSDIEFFRKVVCDNKIKEKEKTKEIDKFDFWEMNK